MTGWEINDLMMALKSTIKTPEDAVLKQFCSDYRPLCSLAAYQFIILRRFKVNYWQEERRIMNAVPEVDSETQWGMTIVNHDGSTGAMFSVALPNNLQYHAIESDGQGNITLHVSSQNSDIQIVKTNIHEAQQKLKSIYGLATEAEIAAAFDSLSNEQTSPEQIDVVYPTIKDKVLGTIVYQPDTKRYLANYKINNEYVVIALELVEADQLLPFIDKVAKKLQNRYYLQAMQAMLIPLVIMKNDFWLTEGEAAMTVEEMKNRIDMTTITFYFDGSSVIECDDDGLFAGHAIIVDLDKENEFLEVNIAG